MLNQILPTVVLDFPGFGKTSFNTIKPTMEAYIDWTKDTLHNQFPDKEIILIGHSFGGRLAANIASQNPNWLKKLILYSAPVIYRPSKRVLTLNSIARIKRKLPLLKNIQLPEKTLLTQSDDSLHSKNDPAERELFLEAIKFDQTEAASRIKIPTLLLWGENDLEVPIKIAHELNKLITNSRLEIMPGLGHNAHLENPNLFYGYVKNFIQHN